jgi:hypothetical protein
VKLKHFNKGGFAVYSFLYFPGSSLLISPVIGPLGFVSSVLDLLKRGSDNNGVVDPGDSGDSDSMWVASQESARIIKEVIKGLWDQVGASDIYTGILAVAKVMLGIGLLFILYRLYYQLTESTKTIDLRAVVAAFIWPIIAIALLVETPNLVGGGIQTNRTNLWAISIALKNVINKFDEAVVSGITGGKNPLAILNQVQGAYQEAVEAMNNCQQQSDTKARLTCGLVVAESIIEDPNSTRKLIEMAESYKQSASEALAKLESGADGEGTGTPSDPENENLELNELVGANNHPLVKLANQFVQPIIQGLLIAIYVMFELVLEISLLLVAIVAPLAVGMSLLPLQTRTLTTWLAGVVALGMTKISFHILTNLASYFAVDANYGGINMAVFMLIGVAAPFIAGSVGSFSATGIQSGVSYMANMVMFAPVSPLLRSFNLLNMLKGGK